MKKLFIIPLAALLIGGCATNPYTGEHANTARGATIGAGAGAILGGVVSSRGDRNKGVLIGTAVGATVGGLIGRQMDQQEAELRREMAGSGVEVVREGDTIRLQAPENITFDTNRADVKPQFQPVLTQLASSIRQYPGTVVQVEGHTDSTGSAAYNQTLSENRATSVRSYLIQQGVDGGRVGAVGYGLTRPVADNSTAAGRAQNRRVEILIVPEQQP
ncbi:glycine zipper 2TM domain-containing protein [Pseudothauera nasutitermitis]|uniref:Glycine zipper 2TM domain-containing protein n=1 Tax=Pseudothauera nasutitermitis TaxID=2565930 RepID=A0A4S4ASK5_9RHOO|nr:OmpA family protein [Pseudothauera nasutitermitis]THF62384.1 glycine zipper 2TM domain-containing protein [Pseudothauera nasutitermitis]